MPGDTKHDKQSRSEARRARLAAELRSNLIKRKQLARRVAERDSIQPAKQGETRKPESID
jgi:hypothetical protein